MKGDSLSLAGELVYEGELMGGEPDGEGTEKLPNGDAFTGEFLSGKRHGKGRLETAKYAPPIPRVPLSKPSKHCAQPLPRA